MKALIAALVVTLSIAAALPASADRAFGTSNQTAPVVGSK